MDLRLDPALHWWLESRSMAVNICCIYDLTANGTYIYNALHLRF